jgi:hypothetical protein
MVDDKLVIKLLEDEARLQYYGKLFWMGVALVSISINIGIIFFVFD